VVVTGGAGYVGAPTCLALAEAGYSVVAIDLLLHGQDDVASALERAGIEVVRGDLLDSSLRRTALTGAHTVVHLAAIVGDPACARDPVLSQRVNVDGAKSLIRDAIRQGVQNFLFASTCSNYGKVTDSETLVDERARLAPVSLYAEQKVEIETCLLGIPHGRLAATCLRLATVYGVAPRMRFDLTVNEFTRDLWAGRQLEVFGEQFWRPYVHVRDIGRAILGVLTAREGTVAGEVFNVGRTEENYRKVDLIREIRRSVGRGQAAFIHRDEDPRDYKVSFEKIRQALGFEPEMAVPDGIDEVVDALERGIFGDPFASRYRNSS
jgi:nucleoside-diphosphate-sugar epimerase